MNRRHQSPSPRSKNPAYRQAFERLDMALEENTQCDHQETIQRMYRAMFDEEDQEKVSETEVIPP